MSIPFLDDDRRDPQILEEMEDEKLEAEMEGNMSEFIDALSSGNKELTLSVLRKLLKQIKK